MVVASDQAATVDASFDRRYSLASFDASDARQEARPRLPCPRARAEAIDKMSDPAASAEERDERRHRLTKGPPEFREARVDRPKAKTE